MNKFPRNWQIGLPWVMVAPPPRPIAITPPQAKPRETIHGSHMVPGHKNCLAFLYGSVRCEVMEVVTELLLASLLSFMVFSLKVAGSGPASCTHIIAPGETRSLDLVSAHFFPYWQFWQVWWRKWLLNCCEHEALCLTVAGSSPAFCTHNIAQGGARSQDSPHAFPYWQLQVLRNTLFFII